VDVSVVGTPRSGCWRAAAASPETAWDVAAAAVPALGAYTRNSIWIYDTTPFRGCPDLGMTAVMDLVTRKWITEIVSAEETSTQIQVVFTDALEAEGLLDEALERGSGGLIDPTVDDERRPSCLPCPITVRR
jgi:hypothetical protein